VKIKQEGVAFDDEEFYIGVRGIAAGVKDTDGNLVGSLGGGSFSSFKSYQNASMRLLLKNVLWKFLGS
jgi:DNA-binding IclR family transcriptional regulator